MRISDWSSDVCSSDLLAEMALKSDIGVLVSEEQPFGIAESFFGEDQGLSLVTVCDTCLADFLDAAGRADVPVDPVGRPIKDRIVFELPGSDQQVPLAELREAHGGSFQNLLGTHAGLAYAARRFPPSALRE